MKKILWGIILSAVVLQGCRKSDDEETAVTAIVAETTDEQNIWDDQSISKYLDENYFDSKGNIVAFDSTITTDDNEKKLSAYDVKILPSGVVFIKRAEEFQPDPGKTIAADDAISLMANIITYTATKDSSTGEISFTSAVTFTNMMTGSGIPLYDPSYYYVKNTVLAAYNQTNSTSYGHSFYEIEGLREGLSYFKSFSLDDSANYNLQGVIIVPSRAAFARDPHYPYGNYSWANRTFVFNFQVYNTKSRAEAGD